MKNNSIRIVLNQYKNENITEDEAIILLEDLFSCNNTIINNPPSYPWTTYPWITYDTELPKYEVTCKIK